jgi:endonuclease/exonuclease/phosphatase family metal-dependent hydrolase
MTKQLTIPQYLPIHTCMRSKLLVLVLVLFSCGFSTAQSIPWQEDFSDLAEGELPDGWTGDTTDNWGAFNANNAGGEAPEMVFWWEPVGSGVYELAGPSINTTGFTELSFGFKHRIRNFGDPGIYTLKVEAIADGERYLITEWVDPDVVPAEELSFTLSTAEHGVGAEDFRIAWSFDGTTDNISQWDLDDVALTLPSTTPELAVSPASHTFPDQQILQSSAPQSFEIRNAGSAPLLLGPDQIYLEARGARSAPFSIMTYNIWFDSQNWPARFNYMLEEIRAEDPDVICLQEVIQRANLPNQAASMADSLGYYYVFTSRDAEGADKRFGNAILSRYPIEATNSVDLSPLNDFRTAIHAQIEVEGNVIDVYNTHLHNTAANRDIRIEQIQGLKNFIDQTKTGELTFLCGDFNANPDWEEMELVYEDFIDVYPLFHENDLDPEHSTLNVGQGHQGRRIDYVFFGKEGQEELQPLRAEVFLNEPSSTGIYGSDHFAVGASFALVSDANEFVLENLESEVVLQPDERATVQVRFAPGAVGLKEINLVVDTMKIPVSGTAFDARVLSFPWFEGFDGLAEGTLPQGWTSTHPNWGAFNGSSAGGSAPEMNFWFEPITTGELRLTTPGIFTEGLDSVAFSFKHRVLDFNDPGPFSLKVLAIVDGEEYVIQEWVDPGDVAANEFETTLYRDQHGIGTESLQLAWVFEGNTGDISQWDIDDVALRALPALSVNPDTADFGLVALEQTSEPIVFTIRNSGGDTLRVSPQDIALSGPADTAFILENLPEEVALAAGEEATFTVSFLPTEEGLQEVVLQIQDLSIPLSGTGSDPTILELPWFEPFDGLEGGGLPFGWSADVENWGAFNANNAGGEAPEMVFWWQPETQGAFPLTSPKVQTGEADSLFLSFKYRVRNFGSPGTYTLKVVTITGGDQHLVGEWVNPDLIFASEFSAILTQEEHGLGAEDLRFAWIFEGPTDNITQWDIDDILLSFAPQVPELAVSETAIDFGNQETDAASAASEVILRNAGGGELTIQPDEIFINGTDAGDFMLENITQEVALAALEEAIISVVFAPQTTGGKQATLHIQDVEIPLSGLAVEPSPYFVYSDFSIVEGGREYTNVGGFREVAGFSAGNLTALDQSGMGEYGNVAVELDFDTELSEARTVYYMWAFPEVDLSAFNRIVIVARAENAATDVKINLQDTEGVNAEDGGSETFVNIDTGWTLIDIPVEEFDLATWATNPPNMAEIQKIDMEFVQGVTQPSVNTVWIDLVGLYFDPATSNEEVIFEAAFNLFPNPAQTHCWVQAEAPGRVQVWSATGQLMKEVAVRAAGSQQLSIAELSAGMYWVRFLEEDGGTAVRMLLKQ